MKIINIGNRVLNNYLVETDKGWVAVDTGYAGGMPRFMAGLRKRFTHLTASCSPQATL